MLLDEKRVQADASSIMETLHRGGVAIFPASVGYAIVGHDESAIRRIYAAKERSYKKPCGNFGDWCLFNECMKVSNRARAVVESIIVHHDLPLSVVAPFDPMHPMIRNMPPFTFRNATKGGTMDLLLNAGALHNEVARLAREDAYCVSGSSANLSLSGSKFVLQHVQQQVRQCADLQIDHGEVAYRNDQGLGSSIIDLGNFETLRVGAAHDSIYRILLEEFDIDLAAILAASDQQFPAISFSE